MRELFYGWWVLGAAVCLGFAAFGVVIPGYLAFSVLIRAELGLSSSQSAFVVGAAWGIGDITSVVAGWLADRYGARRLVLVGGLLCGAGFAALALANSFLGILLAYTVVASVGRGLGIFPTLMTLVNQWFARRKALALAVVNTSTAGGAAALLPVLSLGAAQIGWRPTALVAGLAIGALTLPAVAVIRSRPEDIGSQPDGTGPRARTPANANPGDTATTRVAPAEAGAGRRDFTLGQALVTATFWALSLGAALRTVTSDVLIVNQIPILIWKGVAESRTSSYLSLTYFATIPARFGMGLAALWIAPRWLLSAAMVAVTLCTLAALIMPGDRVAWFLIVASAAGQGVSSIAWITVGEYFGRRSYGTLVGVMTVFYGTGGLIIPAVAGSVFDRTGSFMPVLAAAAGLQAVAAASFLLVKQPAGAAASDSR